MVFPRTIAEGALLQLKLGINRTILGFPPLCTSAAMTDTVLHGPIQSRTISTGLTTRNDILNHGNCYLDATSANGIQYVRDNPCFPLAADSFEDGMGA